MAVTTGATSATANTAVLKASKDKFGELKVEDFLKLMIAELQNQDPLDPMDNSKLVEQINQIRSMQSSTQLTTTLDAVALGQNLSSASGMIGKQIKGLSSTGSEVSGRVDRVAVQNGSPLLYVGDAQLELKNVREIIEG
jgi:flagellar basal-body rod modification protein FlgD